MPSLPCCAQKSGKQNTVPDAVWRYSGIIRASGTGAVVKESDTRQSVCSATGLAIILTGTEICETRWASMISYEMTTRLLKDILPVGLQPECLQR